MPLPNPDIVRAFFESYITIRKGPWGLDFNENDSIHIPDSSKPVQKINISVELLLKFKNARSFDDWLAIVNDLYDKEKAELAEHNGRYAVTKLFVSEPLILKVLRAARTYIISNIKTEEKFKKLKNDLTIRKKELEKDILWQKDHNIPKKDIDENQKQLDAVNTKLDARDDSVDHYITFFKEIIAVYDPDAKRYDEKSFADFEKNVINKSRTLTLCDKLLESQEKKPAKDHGSAKADHHHHADKDDAKHTLAAEKQTPAPVEVKPAPAPAPAPASVVPSYAQVATAPAKPAERKADKADAPKVSASDRSHTSALAANSALNIKKRRPQSRVDDSQYQQESSLTYK